MTNASAPISNILRRAAHVGRALRDDSRAMAAVEAALILPVALTMFALLLYGAEAFDAQRKVTLTARTVTDLVTQSTPTMVSGNPSVPQSSIDNDLSYASCVMTPFSSCPTASANLTMLVTEVLIKTATTATVQWSEPFNGATARVVGSTVTLPTGLGTGQQGNYFIMGEVYYVYTPLNLYTPASVMTLHDAIYLTPRASASLNMLVGQ
jgi:Flp pilus assembly protein TadG